MGLSALNQTKTPKDVFRHRSIISLWSLAFKDNEVQTEFESRAHQEPKLNEILWALVLATSILSTALQSGFSSDGKLFMVCEAVVLLTMGILVVVVQRRVSQWKKVTPYIIMGCWLLMALPRLICLVISEADDIINDDKKLLLLN